MSLLNSDILLQKLQERHCGSMLDVDHIRLPPLASWEAYQFDVFSIHWIGYIV